MCFSNDDSGLIVMVIQCVGDGDNDDGGNEGGGTG